LGFFSSSFSLSAWYLPNIVSKLWRSKTKGFGESGSRHDGAFGKHSLAGDARLLVWVSQERRPCVGGGGQGHDTWAARVNGVTRRRVLSDSPGSIHMANIKLFETTMVLARILHIP
jgi:hypothetical protein